MRRHDERRRPLATLGPCKQIDAGVLDVGYAEVGPAGRSGRSLLLHGWPYDIHSYAEVAPLLAAPGYRVIVPYLRGYGTTRFLSDETFRNGQQSVLAVDAIALMDALGIDRAIVAGFDWGARTANVVAALWPERCTGARLGERLSDRQPGRPAGCRCRRRPSCSGGTSTTSPPSAAGPATTRNRREFAKLIWRTASPQWNFDDATFDRSAASLRQPRSRRRS